MRKMDYINPFPTPFAHGLCLLSSYSSQLSQSKYGLRNGTEQRDYTFFECGAPAKK